MPWGTFFIGEAGSHQIGQKLQAAAANLIMVTSVAGFYIIYYEHAYPNCMDANPLVYQRTRKYEWVTKNSMGMELSRSPGWTETDTFIINRRFKYVWDDMGDIEKSNAVLVDMSLGKPGAIRLADAMSGMSRSMQRFACNSEEMQRLESNRLAYFKSAVRKMNLATK
jgi:hypothetical protein